MNNDDFSIADLQRDFDINAQLDHFIKCMLAYDEANRAQAQRERLAAHDQYFPLYLWDQIP